jgi:hypothetical protein
LAPEVVGTLQAEVTDLVVCAGGVRFSMAPREAVDEHVLPLRGAMAFADGASGLARFVLVSSVLAVGRTTRRVVTSGVAGLDGSHRNAYEWAKQQQELLVRSSSLPCIVVRPGHVLEDLDAGAPDGGERSHGFLALLPALAAGWPVPVAPAQPYWSAPADLVGRTVVAACEHLDPGQSTYCVHPGSPTVGALLDHLALRHGIAPRRIASRRYGDLVASLLRPVWIGHDFDRELLAYLITEMPSLDLGCQADLWRAAGIDPGDDPSWWRSTLDVAIEGSRHGG